jgi:hypothetical protein
MAGSRTVLICSLEDVAFVWSLCLVSDFRCSGHPADVHWGLARACGKLLFSAMKIPGRDIALSHVEGIGLFSVVFV